MTGTASIPTDRTAQRTRARPAILLVLAIVGAMHLPTLFNPFIADDYAYLGLVHDIGWPDVPRLLTSATLDETASGVWWTPSGVLPFYRPIAILSFAVEYRLWGLNPLGFHLTNLVLHLACVYLVWLIAVRNSHDRCAALAAAVIFGVHPAHSEAVLWISGRFDVLVAAAMLLAAYAFLRWQDSDRRPIGWVFLTGACFIVGLGSKETALVLPAVLLALELLRWRGPAAPRQTTRLVGAFSLLGLLAVAYLALRFTILGGLGNLPPPYGVDLSSPHAAGEILRHLAQYLLDFVLLIHVEAFYMDAFWADHWPLLLLLVALAGWIFVWAWRRAGQTRIFRVGTAWAALFTTPALLAMPGERNIYLACAGIACAGGAVYSAAWQRSAAAEKTRRRVRRITVSLLVLVSAIAVVDQGIMWGLARLSQDVYDDLHAALPNPPPGSRIYVINQNPLNSGGFIQGVQLAYNRDDVHGLALTISPQFQGTTDDRVYRTGPAAIRIERRGGRLFTSFLEKFALFSFPVSSMPASAARLDLTLLDPPAALHDVHAIELALPHDLDDPRIHLFVWENSRLKSPLDLIRPERWPTLLPCPIHELPVDVAGN